MALYKITHPATGKVVNLYISSQTGPVPNGTRLSLYSWQNNNDQKWQLESVGNPVILRLARDTSKVINRSSSNNAHVWTYDGTTETQHDSFIDTETTSGNTRIKLVYHGLYLTKNANDNFLSWAGKIESNRQYFKLEEVSGGGGGTSKTLSMPVSYNQKNYGAPVYDQGCALICGLDVSCYYGVSENHNVEYFLKNYWNEKGYTWGSPKATMTEGTYSLSTIKNEIDAGHPVIVHSTGNGTQHWVVAFGYSNSAATVNDIQVLDPYQGAVRTLHDGMRITCGPNYNLDGRIKLTRAKP